MVARVVEGDTLENRARGAAVVDLSPPDQVAYDPQALAQGKDPVLEQALKLVLP